MKHARPKIGDKFQDLTVIDDKSSKGKYHIICKCICGKHTHVSMYHLLSGDTKSCRCQQTKIKENGLGTVSFKKAYGIYKINADKQGRDFSLTLEEFINLVTKNCHYCDSSPKDFNGYLSKNGSQKRRDKKYKDSTILLANIKINGIDRKDNNLGYVLENCLPCCVVCNRAKKDMTFEEFTNWILQLVKYNAA
jgi:hypothetical protein